MAIRLLILLLVFTPPVFAGERMDKKMVPEQIIMQSEFDSQRRQILELRDRQEKLSKYVEAVHKQVDALTNMVVELPAMESEIKRTTDGIIESLADHYKEQHNFRRALLQDLNRLAGRRVSLSESESDPPIAVPSVPAGSSPRSVVIPGMDQPVVVQEDQFGNITAQQPGQAQWRFSPQGPGSYQYQQGLNRFGSVTQTPSGIQSFDNKLDGSFDYSFTPANPIPGPGSNKIGIHGGRQR